MRHAPAFWLGMATAILLSVGVALAQDPQTAIVERWLSSGHADENAPAFTHWDGEDAIPADCALCHSGAGFRDFHGLDGSAAGSIEATITPGGVVDCETCHGEQRLGAISFPSGLTLESPGQSAPCLACHQGRESGLSVAAAVSDTDEDTVDPALAFINPHYAVAAATQQGNAAQIAFQYPGKTYAGPFAHVPPFSQCTDCHDPHATTVDVDACAGCHDGMPPDAIRTSPGDFDGDGSESEGIAVEVADMHGRLMEMMVAYSREVSGAGLVYDGALYPYFFADSDADGAADPDAQGAPVRFAGWTPRLLKAAYNYKVVASDAGAFAHNPHYILQVLYDSIESLADPLGRSVAGMTRP